MATGLWRTAVIMLGIWASAAAASDKPIIAPPAPWVQPAPAPKASTTADAAATHIILADVQTHFGVEGVALYDEIQVRLQTPQGVAGAGNFAVTWNPDLGQLIFHKLLIYRGDQVIDVLAKQSIEVLHREKNLELAMLDGMLTATVQPEDLRVGDIIDVAYTITQKDPALGGHAQSFLTAPNMPVDDIRFRASADKGTAFSWRTTEALEPVQHAKLNGADQIWTEMLDVQPIQFPDGAPPRFKRGRTLELTGFSSWADVSALMAPLFAKASTISDSSPLKAEITKIEALSTDPKIRAEASLKLVQDQVRYLALNMNDGGLIPADADTTWSRRFGDCKGKTALLLALLKGLHIEAQPALVSTVSGDGLNDLLPMIQLFDHVFVRATIAGKIYWLDGARTGDRQLDRLRIPPFHWALPVQETGAVLVPLKPASLAIPDNIDSLKLDASSGLDTSAPAHAEDIVRGDAAIAFNRQLNDMAPADRDRALRQYWNKKYDFIDVKSASVKFDAEANELVLMMDGTANMEWNNASGRLGRQYETNGYALGWKADFKRPAGPHIDAPYAVNFPVFAEATETIVLPKGGDGFSISGDEVDVQAAGYAFQRKMRIDKGEFTLDASTRSLVPEFPATDAISAAHTLHGLSEGAVYLLAPAQYQPTAQDIADLMTKKLTTVDEFLYRGSVLVSAAKWPEAITDLKHALALNPKSAEALAYLSVAEMESGSIPEARHDLTASLALDHSSEIAFFATGELAMRDQKYGDAVEAYNRAVAIAPDDSVAHERRMFARLASGDIDGALGDSTELVRGGQASVEVHEMRFEIFVSRHQLDQARAESDAMVAEHPNDVGAHLVRAISLEMLHQQSDADAEFTKSLQIRPTAAAYFARAKFRSPSDYTGKLADLNAALALNPTAPEIFILRAQVEVATGGNDKAIADLSHAIDIAPKSPLARFERAKVYAATHRASLAESDLSMLRGKTTHDKTQLSTMCGGEQNWDVPLDMLLENCDVDLMIRIQ